MYTNDVNYSDMFNSSTIDGDINSTNASVNNLYVDNISSLISPSPIVFNDNIQVSLVIGDLQSSNSVITNLQVSNISSSTSPSPIVISDDVQCSLFIGDLEGNATTASFANSATSFTGPLLGNVTGTQNNTIIQPNTFQ